EFRVLVLSAHGFAHAFSSIQELMFSMERAFACARPSSYHDRTISLIPLFLGQVGAVGLAFYYCVLLAVFDEVIVGCVITNVIDSIALLCLIITKLWTDKKKKQLLLSGLKAKYQVREAFEITQVMLPCCVISLILKTCAMAMVWMYGLHIFNEIYAYALAAGLYLVVSNSIEFLASMMLQIETVNCMICTVLFLMNHSKLRQVVFQ
ncbi:hypothetical protein PMAYCL1PPCAC_08414, partial [Pristionchus mayeri]